MTAHTALHNIKTSKQDAARAHSLPPSHLRKQEAVDENLRQSAPPPPPLLAWLVPDSPKRMDTWQWIHIVHTICARVYRVRAQDVAQDMEGN